MDGIVHTPGVGGGSQSGSDFDFLDPLLRGGDPAGAMQYLPSPMGMQAGYASTSDPTLVAHQRPTSSFPDPNSPALGHRHRLSTSSAGGYAVHDLHGNVPGSGNTSPDAFSNSGIISQNPYAHNSNDSIPSQGRGDEGDGRMGDGSGAPLPAWSELKTKAGKERKRLPLACIACRRKKIRCSGEKPACKHCLRSRIPCVYKVTTRKAAPRTDYMAMLDKRLKRMEERVIKVIPKDEQDVIASTGRAVVKPPLPPAPPRSAASSKKRAADAAFEEELDEWAEGHTSAAGADTGQTRHSKEQPSMAPDSDEHTLLHEGADSLPSKELQEHLSETFFDFVYCQSYPLLHKPSFMRRLAQDQVPPVLMLAVCAISARFSNHPGVRTEPTFLRGEAWAAPARDIALRRYDSPNITILIVYLILGLHEFGTCHGGRSWMFGGMAQRMAYALQLHKDLDHDRSRQGSETTELTFTDREIRRRTMWACFLMDRFNSSGTERPIFIGEQYIRAQLPIKDSHYQMEITGPTEDLDGNVPNPVDATPGSLADARDNMGASAYLIRLVAIFGRLVNYMNLGGKDNDKHPMWDENSGFHSIRKALQAWRDSLPDSLVYTPENVQNHASERIANQFVFLHIAYNQVALFMNRFALPLAGNPSKRPPGMPASFLSEAYKMALDAANQISAMMNDALDHQVVAPFAGYGAFYSSTVHIYGAFSKNAALEASSKQNLARNVKYLTKMKKYWGMFHFVTENLRELYRRQADAARSGHSREGSEQSIFQYGDWFDRYPHGVSGTDFDEPSAEPAKEPGADAVLGQKSDLQTVEEFFSKLAPPSRAVQKEAQQPQSRKTAKRRQTRSEGKQPPNSSLIPRGPEAPTSAPALANNDMVPMQNMAMSMPGFPSDPTSFPSDPQQLANAATLDLSSQPMMAPIDRQMVLNSYAGIAPSPNASMLDSTMLNLEGFRFPALGPNNGNSNGGGMFGDYSTGWFMPFNMEPPPGGDDGNFLGGGAFDWAGMANFVDLPSGLPADVEGGAEGLANTGADPTAPVDGLDGFR